MLSLAVKIAISDRDIDGALSLIEAAENKVYSENPPIQNFEWLAMAAIDQVCLVLKAQMESSPPSVHNEYGLIQSWFKQNYSVIFAGSSLEKVKAGRYVPDFMLRLASGELIPVECKKNFNARALRQLQAYMQHFELESGIAVACKLTTTLPENIKFIARPLDNLAP